ncbi:hypothetical protein, partial [Shewanella sp.]|uniref:hypothetical protein n=1 Tax=Shewanella sp. TaxID=50422 RepID=UPI003D0DE1FA
PHSTSVVRMLSLLFILHKAKTPTANVNPHFISVVRVLSLLFIPSKANSQKVNVFSCALTLT